jgi:para-nitrobenzyl esterase
MNINKTTTSETVRSWLGVPYATAKRFCSPVLLPYNPNLNYDQKGAAPFQTTNISWLEADNGVSEDCLNLNVWAPENIDKKPLPVIIYIYGGGFEAGANTQTTSNASGLAETGRVIGVSLNYRLGPFGWLSLSQYGGVFSDATNLGLQDIITALKWVKENIAQFGGDPNNVTVTGHSAGAYITTALIAAPSANGLFHRIAAFSGGASRIVPTWWAEELAIKFLTELGIADRPEKLLTLDAKLLAETLIKVSPRDIGDRHGIDNTTIGIVNDYFQNGSILANTPLQILKSGLQRNIDVLFSTATNEADWWVINATESFNPGTIENFISELVTKSRIPRSHARKIVAAYDVNGRTPVEVRGAVFTDYFFTLPATRAALANAEAGGKSYLLSVGSVEGSHAVHGTEMYGIVGQQCPNQSDEQAVRDTFVRDSLINFATGNHNQLWKPVTAELYVKGIGNQSTNATSHALDVLQIFEGIERT